MTELDLKNQSPNDAKPVLQAVLSLFDGVNPSFCLVFVADFCIFALWKNN